MRHLRVLRLIVNALAWIATAGVVVWSCAALYFDLGAWGLVATAVFAALVLAALIVVRGGRRKMAALLGGFIVVLLWWFTLQPRNDRTWQPDVARTAFAEIAGDIVTLHDVRNCDYRTENDYTPRWETCTVRLSQLTALDVTLCYWGSPWMAHPIVSFEFADAPPLAFSVETRKEIGESYSALRGFFRQYELIYVVADERDVTRLRTNYRTGEDAYLYRTAATPEQARARFLEYLHTLNALHATPRWYNAATANCTTSVRTQRAAAERVPWDWRLLLNGKMDEFAYERHAIVGDLPFAELKSRAHVNAAAQAAGDAPDFSARIRTGRPGFPAPVGK